MESADLFDLEHAVLQAIVDRDAPALTHLLDTDFLITTAGWLGAPAGREEWVREVLSRHALHGFVIESLDQRSYGDVLVALVLSSQTVTWQGEQQIFRFRYTDIWRTTGTRRVLAIRHASIVPTTQPVTG